MLYKLGKKIFRLTCDTLRLTQIILIFLSFATILYWLFQLGGATFIQPVAPFFESIKSFTHLFYTRTVSVGGSPTIDFSFLIAAFLMLAIVWGIKLIVEGIEVAEKKYDSAHNFLKKKSEQIFNVSLEKNYVAQESKNNKFLILISFCAENLTKDSFYNRDTNLGIEEKQKLILTDFAQSFSDSTECQKKILQNSVLFYFNNFNEVDAIIISFENTIKEIKQKYHAQQWKIESVTAIETYANDQEIMSKVETLKMIIKLNLKNKITCLSTFKQRYSLVKSPKYMPEGQGVYKIHNEEEEVFCLTK